MKKQVFDDQHQPMSSWLDKLASDEFSNSGDLKDDQVVEHKPVKYAGTSSTWNKKNFQDQPIMLDDSTRKISQIIPKASTDSIETQARKLLMSGLSIEKMATVLKQRYSKNELSSFFEQKTASLEKEFGKLGYIYLDASLADNCNDLSIIQKTNNKVASIAVKYIKKISKCDDCNFNKKSHCLKLNLSITENPQIKTAAEATAVIKKFATLKYVNSYLVKSSDLSKYYSRLANENPETVLNSFLSDLNDKRTASMTSLKEACMGKIKENIENRVSASNHNERLQNNEPIKVSKVEEPIQKLGKVDLDVGNAFKQFLLTNSSIRTAKAEISKRYGKERVDAYFKEAKTDIVKYLNFVNKANATILSRLASKETSNKIENKKAEMAVTVEEAKLASAIKLAYSLKSGHAPIDEIRTSVTKMYGDKVAKSAIEKLAADKEAQLLGLTYIDSSLYANTSELKRAYDTISRKVNTLFQIKAGNICKLEDNSTGLCPTTGLKIVKSASLDGRKQALQFVKYAKVKKIANEFELNKLELKVAEDGNSTMIKAFINSNHEHKRINAGIVKQITDVALKYATDIGTVRRVGTVAWGSVNKLVEALEPNIVNKIAFKDELKKVMDRSASDANQFLTQANQFNSNIFPEEQPSDVSLGNTI